MRSDAKRFAGHDRVREAIGREHAHLQLLTVLTASVGTAGGTSPMAWNKYKPTFWEEPMPADESRGLPPPRLLELHFQKITPP